MHHLNFYILFFFYSFWPDMAFAQYHTFTRFGRARTLHDVRLSLVSAGHDFAHGVTLLLVSAGHGFLHDVTLLLVSARCRIVRLPFSVCTEYALFCIDAFSSRPADRWALKKVRNRVLTNSAESISLKSGTRFTGSSRNAISRLARFSQGPLSQRTRANYAHLTIGTHSNLLQGAVGIRFGIAGNRIIIA